MTDSRLLWQPSEERVKRSQMYELMTGAARKYGFKPDWPSLHRWSVEHREQFWKEMFEFAGIKATKPAKAVMAGDGMLGTKWFTGLEFNFAQHLLRFDDDRLALTAEDERGRQRTFTYRQLRDEVARLAGAMRAVGVTRGDRVGAFMPNIPEAVIAMLATASIGAVWSSCSPDFGINGVFDRFGQIAPKMLFSADGYTYNGKPIDSLERVRGIVERIPSIQKVVIAPFLGGGEGCEKGFSHQFDMSAALAISDENRSPGASPSRERSGEGMPVRAPAPLGQRFSEQQTQVSSIPNAVVWGDFCGTGLSPVETQAGRLCHKPSELVFESVPFDHPLYIMYSSGTTGIPKCIVHGAGGTLLQHMKELMLHTDLRREDVLFYFTTCGWMMWNWLVSGLGVGCTVALFEGNPGYPDMSRLWRFAERIGMTVFGTSAKYIASCEKAGIKPGKEQNLSKLRAVLSTGSPLTIENFCWVYENVKEDLQLASISGGTDIISCFALGNPILPVYAGELQSVGLGMDVHAFGADAKPVIGEKGELVCCSPFPSQPTGFWNDRNHEKYKAAYFDVYPGIWRHGDFVEITEHGGVIIYGRSDATLNPGGVRIGTAEIYRQVETIEEIVDSVVVGKNTPDADVDVCLFVVLRPGATLDEALLKKIKTRIAEGTTKRHVPKHIKQVSAVPYTISGKKVEIAVTRMIHGEPVPNRDALANPDALEQYAGIV